MSYSELIDAIADLKLYFNSPGRSEVLGQAVKSSEVGSDQTQFLQQWILDVVDGGISTAEIQEKIEQFVKDGGEPSITDDTIQIIDASAINEISGEQTNASEKSNDKSDPVISHIMIKRPEISLGSRFADAAALLMTVIPSYEWSRAVPYLSVTLHTSRPAIDSDGRVTSVSQGRFLLGPKKVDANTVEGQFVTGPEFTDETGRTRTIAGMELFTSPQTLVNVNANVESVRATPIIDPTRPFMSIKSLNLSIVPQGAGTVSYKSGELNLILHDRSRLSDIADFIRPDLFNRTELLIEYGWSHPDGGIGSTNMFGRLINASRVREKYGVKNHSLEFKEGGQVDIKVEIWTQGVSDLSTAHIAETPTISNATRVIENLIERIAVYREQVTSTKTSRKSVIAPQILESLSDVSKHSQLPPALLDKIKEMSRQEAQNSDVTADPTELLSVIDELLGSSGDGTDGVLASTENSLQAAYASKKASLTNGIDPSLEAVGDLSGLLTDDSRNQYVSIGKLLTLFLGIPLAATGRYDEVQLLTYTFNKGAGAIRGKNIGSFPININEFITNFDQYTRESGHANIPVQQFIQYIIGNYLDDITYLPYGLGVANKTSWLDGEKTGVLTSASTETLGAVYDEVRAEMVKFGVPDGDFVPPQVTHFLEAVPKGRKENVEGDGIFVDTSNDDITILRVHIFDQADTPHYGYKKFLDTLSNHYVGSSDNSEETTAEMFQEAENLGLGTIDKKQGSFTINPNITPQEIKKQVSSRVPNLHYGVQGSGIITANLKSLHQALLGTDHMQKKDIGDPSVAPGVDGGAVPLWMFPTEIDITTLGCPFFNFGQQFFVDFDTATDIDNIYGVMGSEMTIEPGRFETTAKLHVISSYGSYRSTIPILQSAKATIEIALGEETA